MFASMVEGFSHRSSPFSIPLRRALLAGLLVEVVEIRERHHLVLAHAGADAGDDARAAATRGEMPRASIIVRVRRRRSSQRRGVRRVRARRGFRRRVARGDPATPRGIGERERRDEHERYRAHRRARRDPSPGATAGVAPRRRRAVIRIEQRDRGPSLVVAGRAHRRR